MAHAITAPIVRAPSAVTFTSRRSLRPRGRAAFRCNADLSGQVNNGNVKQITSEDDFGDAMRAADSGLVAVQVSTKTCGPCKLIYPHFASLSEELPNVTFLKVMGDDNESTRSLMRDWGVKVVPLFILFRNGMRVHDWSGAKADVLRDTVMEYCTEEEKVVNA